MLEDRPDQEDQADGPAEFPDRLEKEERQQKDKGSGHTEWVPDAVDRHSGGEDGHAQKKTEEPPRF